MSFYGQVWPPSRRERREDPLWRELMAEWSEPRRCNVRQVAVPNTRCPNPAEFRLGYTDSEQVDEQTMVCAQCLTPALLATTRRCPITVERLT